MKSLQQKPPERKRREDKMRREVRQRDGKIGCRFERRAMSGKWFTCGRKNDVMDPVHIIRRPQCGKVWDDKRVVMLGCRACHKNYDNQVIVGVDPIYEVRVPYDLAITAWEFVVANTKSKPYARYNPEENGLYKDLLIGKGVA